MRRTRWARLVLVAALFLGLWSSDLVAQTHVRGYTRKNGTYVAPHERKAPSPRYGTPKSATPPAPHASSPRSSQPRASSREHRSEAAKREFEKATGHPHGWKGHVVDHIVPLACGGTDSPSNMQWQTTEEGKAKDKVERKGCGAVRH